MIKACRSLPNKSLWWEAFITLCYSAGTRANEAIHLTWSDIDFENERVRIVPKAETAGLEAWRPKDYDPPTVRAPSHTIALLSRLHSEADEGSEFVFVPQTRAAWIRIQRATGRWTEGAAVVNNMTRDFKAIVRKAGILDATLHDLRRSCITHWAKRLAAPVVQELAGHVDIKTTLTYYVTIRDEDMSEAADITARTLLSDAE
ncbi:MAG: tyrosine-type recombinase/integrase [Phycisphaerales bacterium]|nr:MAG: tyrosine-type recombinase/integrase [Phycisphaerales bacterium]